MSVEVLRPDDLDVPFGFPRELHRVVEQGLTNLAPWHIMNRELAKKRLAGMRTRYRTKYIPFARRQDNDDLAAFEPGMPGRVVVVHDFANEGSERVAVFDTFWDWFRAAIGEMITFE